MTYYWNGEKMVLEQSCRVPQYLIVTEDRPRRYLWKDGMIHDSNRPIGKFEDVAYWPNKEAAVAFLSQQMVPVTPEYDEIDQMED